MWTYFMSTKFCENCGVKRKKCGKHSGIWCKKCCAKDGKLLHQEIQINKFIKYLYKDK